VITPQFILPLASRLVIDLFAGGGGASTGIEQALGRHVDIAVNHDPAAVSLHQANHPQTRHFVSDVFEVDPLAVTQGQDVGLLWASPDCKHFSKAKGGKPVSKKIRGLAWVVVKWAKLVRPDVICLENVEEFQDWGPLTADGMPCPIGKGKTFRRWKASLQSLGYKIEHRELRACDYGAPTIRKRLFLVARCDGQPIVWPAPTHAKAPAKGSGLKPWRTAAECIDWSIPCPSIFERERPLAEATQRRIAHGIKRYVLDNPKPYIVDAVRDGGGNLIPPRAPLVARIGQTGGKGKYSTGPTEPISTITSKAEHLLVSPTLVQTGYGERPGQAPRVPGMDKPLGTAVDGQKHGLVAAFMAQHNTGVVGHHMTEPVSTIVGTGSTQALVSAQLVGVGGPEYAGKPRAANEPLGTVPAQSHRALVTSNLVKLRGTSNSASTADPLGTVSAQGFHHAQVYAFLDRYFGTQQDARLEDPLHAITTKDRDSVVTVMVDGEPYAIADIGMRMLQPRELYRAQGFSDSYLIDRGADGRALTKAEQVRMCGNSVCPPLARAIVAANYSDAEALRKAA
jgi:DNA (cytosine-5)-methyltransferase 1